MNYSDKLALIREYKIQGGKGSYLSLLKSYERGGNLPQYDGEGESQLPEKERLPLVSNYYNTSLSDPIYGLTDKFVSMISNNSKPVEDLKLSPQEYLYSTMTSPRYQEIYLDNYYNARKDRAPGIYNEDFYPKEMVKRSENYLDQIRSNLGAVSNSRVHIKNSGPTNFNHRRKDVYVSSDLDALPHELAHNIPEGNYDLTTMYNSMFEKYIPTDPYQERLKSIVDSKKYKDALEKADKIHDITRLNYKVSSGTHDMTPAEVRSDIYDLRYKLYKSGIHDFRERPFDSKDYKKALKQFEGTILERLFKAYSKEDLIELMNTVVNNTAKNDKTTQIS